jgi:hypothetical protein
VLNLVDEIKNNNPRYYFENSADVAEYIKASQKHANARVSLNPKRAGLEQLKEQIRKGTTGNNTAQCTANDFPTPAPKHGPQAVTEQHAPTAVNKLPVGFEVGD